MDELVTNEQAGGHFVAITDPGTNLEKLAREHGFRHVFLNPPISEDATPCCQISDWCRRL